jgi:translation initiation factor IF-2
MAKVRVYQLAKELGVENIDLMSQLREMGIAVKSHSSTVDEEVVLQLKGQTVDTVPTVVEKRISGGVIRRRTKKAKAPVIVPEPVDEIEEEQEEETAAPEAPESDVVAEAEASADDGQEAAVLESAEEETVAPEDTPVEEPATEELAAAETEEQAEVAHEPPVQETEEPVAEESAVKEPAAESTSEVVAEAAAEEDKTAEVVAEEVAPKKEKDKKQPEAVETAPQKTAEKVVKKGKGKVEAKDKKPLVRSKRKKSQPAARILELPKIPIDPEVLKPRAASAPKKTVGEAETEDKGVAGKRRKKKGLRDKKDVAKPQRRRVITRKKEFGIAGYDWVGHGVMSSGKRKKKVGGKRESGKTQVTTPKAIKRQIKIEGTVIVSDFGRRIGVKVRELLKLIRKEGVTVGFDDTIDFDMAAKIAEEYDYEVVNTAFEENEVLSTEVRDDPKDIEARPPIVTVMGHVDHGKTSLLDAIRKTNVADGEAGGITQHIGAYTVTLDTGRITFIDTPGHEAFTAMRARGAAVTDIVILVVAADDGIMPQTLEAIDHSRAAGVPLVVAINKVDRPNADVDKVKKQLADNDLLPEDWGGETITCEISAKEKTGIDKLLEMVLLQAEMLELGANVNKKASGYVIEARIDKGRGPVATLLILEGTMNRGDSIVCGATLGKVRALLDYTGKPVKQAGPSMAIEVQGLQGVPNAGELFNVVKDEKDGKRLVEHRQELLRGKEQLTTSKRTLEDLFLEMEEGYIKQLDLLIKADVQGSVEALGDAVRNIKSTAAKVNILRTAVGGITESDVMLASASDNLRIIIGFNVRPSAGAIKLGQRENVDIKTYSVIYEVIDDLQAAMLGMLDKKFVEKTLGRAEVRQTFHIPKVGTVAGSFVIDGNISRNAKVRLLRDDVVVFTGNLRSLRRFKDDVKEVQQGYECGIGVEGYNDIKVGDAIEFFVLEEEAPQLN